MNTIEEVSKKIYRRFYWSKATWPFRWFFKWIIKSVQYAWVLRNDVDWDWSSVFSLLEYKLSRVRQALNTDPYTSKERQRRIFKDIKTCELLLKRIRENDYFLYGYDKILEKWGDSTGIFPNRPARSLTPEESEKERKDWKELHDYEDYMRKQDMDLFVKIFTRKYRDWWN